MTTEEKESTATLDIPADLGFFITSWRRGPFDPSVGPLSLNISSGVAKLASMEEPVGNLWYFQKHKELDAYWLCCNEMGDDKKMYLHEDLTLHEKKDSTLWSLESHPSLRGCKSDISVRIFKYSTVQQGGKDMRLCLCSKESEQSVHVVSDGLASQRAADKQWIYNNAWECVPDVEENDEDDSNSLQVYADQLRL